MIYSIFIYTIEKEPICSNCVNDLIDKLEKEKTKMEDEIKEKLEKMYNHIIMEVNYIKKDTFKISGSIKTNNKNGVIRKGFTFDFEYDRKLTLDFNVECISKIIDKYIIELFKCNSFDNWTECEKRGCKRMLL